jgi:hypothetical protein
MSIKHSIKKSFGRFFLKREPGTARNKAFFNLADAKTIGILFCYSTAEDFDLLKKYVIYLKECKKKVKVIGYFDMTEEPPNLSYSKVEYEFFTRKDLNWHLRPENIYINNFIEEERDVLIDLNVQGVLPLQFITRKAKANFKIGKFSDEGKEIYDMLIDSDSTKSFKCFLAQVDTYLSMINKKETTNE